MPLRYELRDVNDIVIPLRGKIVSTKMDGFGMPDFQVLSQRRAQQDGVEYVGSTITQRVVTMGFEIYGKDDIEIWETRRELLDMFSQMPTGFHLRVILPTGERFQLDLRYAGGLSLPRPIAGNPFFQTVAVQCLTYDRALWYDPTPVVLSYSTATMLGTWVYPLAFPAGFGSSIVGAADPIVYPGTWRTYPKILIIGPAEDIVISNTTTGKTLTFIATYALPSGRSCEIDLTPGYKTITNSFTGDDPGALTDDSDLATFCIQPKPIAAGGVNIINVALTAGGPTTRVRIEYDVLYLGI